MKTTITRKIEFDSGHRVLRHGSKCKYIHGHRYVAEIMIYASELNELGMVIDFGLVKELVGDWVDTYWDHNVLLHKEDPLLPFIQNTQDKIPYIMKYGNPTAENMARELYEISVKLLPSELAVENVRLYETPNCFADYSENK